MSTRVSVIVFDVNETLSDMSPMAARFVEVGAPANLAIAWFAGLLRDGFALAAAGDNEKFALIGAEALRGLLRDVPLSRSLEEAREHILGGLAELDLHPDVVNGVRVLRAAGFRMVTLSNGSTQVAERLLTKAGIRSEFETLLSVQDAPAWKPVRAAYDYAADACGVEPDQMILVAAHPWDIHGASRAGMQTAWLNRSDDPYPGYFTAPEYTIRAPRDLAVLLGHPDH